MPHDFPRACLLFFLFLAATPYLGAEATARVPTTRTIGDALIVDLKAGDIDAAQLQTIRLQLSLIYDGLKTKPDSTNGDAATARTRFTKALDATPTELYRHDPSLTLPLIAMAEKIAESIDRGDQNQAGTDLTFLAKELAALHTKQSSHTSTSELLTSASQDEASYLPILERLITSLQSGDLQTAEGLAPEILVRGKQFEMAHNGYQDAYGQGVYSAYDALGRAAFRRGDFISAGNFLSSASHTPGSPRIKTFGPNLWLTKALLDHGDVQPVVQFLKACKSFWPNPKLDQWLTEIASGNNPSLLPNAAETY